MKSNKSHKIKGKNSPKENHYIDKEEFFQCLFNFRSQVEAAKEKGKPPPKPTDEIGSYIIKLSHKVATNPCFARYPFKEEMIAEGIENCVKAINNYKIEDDAPKNPFGYFTQILYWAYIRKIKKETNIYYGICKIKEQTYINHESTSVSDKYYSEARHKPCQEFIERFEAKKKDKSEKEKAERLRLKG